MDPADSSDELPSDAEAIQLADIDSAAELEPEVRLEDAILSEEEHPEANILDDLAASAQTALDTPWTELESEGGPPAAAQLDSASTVLRRKRAS
jgi:hypothetical protein